MAGSSSPDPEQVAAPITQTQLHRERLRFGGFDLNRTPSGQCSAEVRLEWLDGVSVVGKASGHTSPMGDHRIAAEATLRALEQFSGTSLKFELVGVKAVRAFDANVVIVAIHVVRGEGPKRLLGVHLAETDPMRSTVLAVLNATNRLLGNFIAR
jgi:hypothetical protein